MATARDEKHRYGQHYTPETVASLLAAFAVRSDSDLVLDPSCGDGRLLRYALAQKQEMGGRAGSGEVFGIDRSAEAILEAAKTGTTVACADFFNTQPGARLTNGVTLPDRFDAIVGNPPYVRHEFMSAVEKRRIIHSLGAGSGHPWSGRSDLYVYFFARAADFLRAGGRLVFLTAGSWLDVAYGSVLRDFLLKNFRIIAVIESIAESFFADASVNTVITVLERDPDETSRGRSVTRFVQLLKPLSEIVVRRSPVSLARSIVEAETTSDWRVRLVGQATLGGEEKWGRYLRAEDVFFEVVERGRTRLGKLSEFASVRFGVKTGANNFFYLTPDRGDGMKRLAELATIRRGFTTGANEFFYLKASQPTTGDGRIAVQDGLGATHLIEPEYLAPVVFSLKEVPGILLKSGRVKRVFFRCSDPDREGARAYIQAGERAGYHLRPTCAARAPWYSVLKDREPAPLIFPSKIGERWLVALNEARVFEDKKLYGIFPRDGISPVLLAALLNSTWARYNAEVTCRQMTGAQAIADIDVVVAEHLFLPDPQLIPPEERARIESALLALATRPVVSVFEEVRRDDRKVLDKLVLHAIGFTQPDEQTAMLSRLYDAVTELVRVRLQRGTPSL